MEDKYKEIQDDLQRKWQSVHAKFRYTTADDPLAVTMDRRVYFKTKHDVNLFADTLRVMVLKVVKYLKKKQNIMLKRSLEQWKKSVGQFLESGLAVDHFNDVAIDTDTDRKFVRNSVEYEKDVLSEHEKILTQFQPYMSVPSVARVATPAKSSEEKGSRIIRRDTIDLPINNEIQIHISAPSNDGYDESVVSPAIKPIDSKYIDESSYESVMNLPMRIPRDQSNVLNDHLTSEKKLSFNDVPSYLPSKDIQNLPELLPIYDPMTADGRLYIKNDRRLEYCSYRKVMQGPTDSCSWVIPNRLLMGSIPIEDVPTGQGKTTIPAVSLLMLAGIDIFISLMEEDEETKYIKDLDKTPIEQYISTSLTKANAIVNQIIIENHEVINKQLEKLASVPEYGKTDPRYAKAYRERLRYKARIRLAHDIINRTKVQFKKLPSKVCWYRISNLSTSSTPNINELLPHLWRMENELKYYHNIFIYSKEGHGRVGMIGALLLGRIYELHPYESLYRVQLSHDSSTREAQREQVITCPQLPVQRKLVVDALLLSSRILSQPNVRTQLNPDTYIDHKRVRDVMSMTRLSKEKKSEKFKEKKEEIAESLKDEYLQLVKTMDKRLLKLPALASPRSVKRFLKGGNLSQQDEEEDPLEKKFREYAALYDELDDHTDYDVHNEEFQRAENKRQKHSLRLDHLLVMPKDSKINDHLKFSYSSKSRQSSFSGGASRSGISRTSSRATDRSFQRKMRGSRTSRDSFDSVLNENYLRRVGTVIEEDESLASGKVEGDLSFKPAKENKDGRETVSGVRSNTSSRPTSGSMISRIRKSFGSLVDLVDQSFSTQSKENSENESSDRPSSRHSHHSMHEERTIMLEKMGSVDGQESFHSITIPSNHPIVVAAKSRDSDRPSRRFKRIPSPKVRGEVSTIATEIAEKLAKARDSKDHSSESEHSYSSRKYTRRETSSKLNRKHRRNSRGSRGSRDSFDSQKRAPLTESQFSSLMINPTEVSSVAQNNKTNKMVREAALAASAPSLTELYGSVGQMKDIVRTLPVRRHIPAEDAKLPLIRQRITRPRSKSPARSPIRRSSSVK